MSLSVEMETPCLVCERKTTTIPVMFHCCEECKSVTIQFPDGAIWVGDKKDMKELIWWTSRNS